MTRKKIEFAPPTAVEQLKSPGDFTASTAFEDLIFKDEFTNRKLKLETGYNWIRILPALLESNTWMLNIPTINTKHARFAHPRTLQKGSSAFDRAYRWFAKNAPDQLYNRNNPTGFRLLCSSLCACWCVVEDKAGKVEVRLFIDSANDGAKGGSPGLGFLIGLLPKERDEDGNLVEDPIQANRGALVCIEKSQPAGVKYPAYTLRAGRLPAPIQSFLDRMDDAEIDVLCPIEQTIRVVTEEEQWQHLARVVGADIASKIRSSDA
jgi:hypothetical protein